MLGVGHLRCDIWPILNFVVAYATGTTRSVAVRIYMGKHRVSVVRKGSDMTVPYARTQVCGLWGTLAVSRRCCACGVAVIYFEDGAGQILPIPAPVYLGSAWTPLYCVDLAWVNGVVGVDAWCSAAGSWSMHPTHRGQTSWPSARIS